MLKKKKIQVLQIMNSQSNKIFWVKLIMILCIKGKKKYTGMYRYIYTFSLYALC